MDRRERVRQAGIAALKEFKNGDHVRITRTIPQGNGRKQTFVFTGKLAEMDEFVFMLDRDDLGERDGYYAWDLGPDCSQTIEKLAS